MCSEKPEETDTLLHKIKNSLQAHHCIYFHTFKMKNFVYYTFKTYSDEYESMEIQGSEISIPHFTKRLRDRYPQDFRKEGERPTMLYVSCADTKKLFDQHRQMLRAGQRVIVNTYGSIIEYSYKDSKGNVVKPKTTKTRYTYRDYFGDNYVPPEQQKPKKIQKTRTVRATVPPHMLCILCKGLLKDAVIVPCCGYSYCWECTVDRLEDKEKLCLHGQCFDPPPKIPDLIPNRALRSLIESTWSPYVEEVYEVDAEEDEVNATQQPQRVPPGIPPHLVGMPPQVIRAYLRDQRDKTRDEATSTSPQPTAQIHVPTQQPHRDSSGPHGQESNSSEDWSRKRTYPYADYQTSTAKRPRLKSALIQLG